MKERQIFIFEFPSNLGLLKKEWDFEPGVNKLPKWLRKYGFHDLINPDEIFYLKPPKYSMEVDRISEVRNADRIIEYAKNQSELIFQHIGDNNFNIVIGGDCSILIGNAIALKRKGNYGLFFLDGHTDFILPELSETAGAAGMDLAIVTGYGHEKLTNIFNLQPYFDESNVWCVGNSEYDQEYIEPILNSNINYFDLNSLRQNGIENCIQDFLNMVEENNLDGFFIHFDVDVLNDEIMPAVDSRQDDGINYSELIKILNPLITSKKVAGIEITILDPNLDPDGQYTIELISVLNNLFKCL